MLWQPRRGWPWLTVRASFVVQTAIGMLAAQDLFMMVLLTVPHAVAVGVDAATAFQVRWCVRRLSQASVAPTLTPCC